MSCCTICGLSPSKVTEGNLSVGFHRFPSDPVLRQAWEDFCGGPKEANARVCSDHFAAECYRRGTKATEPGQRHMLRDGAVPTIWEGTSLKTWERRMEKKQKRFEESLMAKNQIKLAPIMEPLIKLENVCRICESETSLHDLSLEENAEPARRFCSLTSLQIDSTAPWCCAVCLGQLNDAYDFVQRCIEADSRRKSLLASKSVVEVKEEPQEVWEEPVEAFRAGSSVGKADEDNSDDSSSESDMESKIKAKFKVYKCEACEATFENIKDKFAHVKTHGRERFPCKQCGKAFPRKSSLDAHMNTHKTEPTFICSQCSAGFNSNTSLVRHVKGVHLGLKPFDCEECGRKFAQKTQLQAHAAVHMEKVDVPCKLCDEKLKTTLSLRNHMLLVHGETLLEKFEFECEVCNKVFPTGNALYQHKQSHREPDFLCNICGNKYRTKSLLASHLTTHNPARPFRCDQCSAEFKTSKTLHYHQLVHAGLKPHQCQLCDRAFRTKVHLKTHTMSVHTKEKPHECSECHRQFTLPGNLRLHMKVHQKLG